MPIHVFCEACGAFTPLNIIETIKIKSGIDGVRFECERCGHTWWQVDDYREELEEDQPSIIKQTKRTE